MCVSEMLIVISSVAHEHILKRENIFESFPSKAETNDEAILKTYELFIYGDIYYITDSFCKKKC